jgi:hypothetical protein
MVRKLKNLLVVWVTGICALGSSAVFAAGCPDLSAYPLNGCSLPGLVGGSFPFFSQSVFVTLKNKNNGDFKLKARYGGVATKESTLFFSPSIEDTYTIFKTSFRFNARYKNGDLTGSIRIKGKIPDLNIDSRQMLMTADLTGVWNSTGQLIGFNTMNIWCNAAINAVAACTHNEVIYFSQLKDSLDLGGSKGKFKTTGLAVTSVPIPATAWLFASGLIGLAGAARRKHA